VADRVKAMKKVMDEEMSQKQIDEILRSTPSPMDVEGMKRAKEPTGAWRKRQGLGPAKWWESEY